MRKHKMFVFAKQWYFFGCNISNVILLKCVPVNNQDCKVRPEIININKNEPLINP